MAHRVRDLLPAAVVFAIALAVFLYQAHAFYEMELSRNGLGYVSDEVWYVGSSKAILAKVFGGAPRTYGWSGATIVFREMPGTDILSEIAQRHGVSIRTTYSKLKAVYVNGTAAGVNGFIAELRGSWLWSYVEDVMPGWPLPDASGINNYLNLEHPPLAKYITAAVIAGIGDNPFNWRIPIALFGAITAVLVYFIAKELSRSAVLGLIASLLLIADPISRALFSINLLDGYVALFAALSLYLAVKRKYELALYATIAGGLFKFSGLLTAIPLFIIYLRGEMRREPSFANFLYSAVFFVARAAIMFLAAFTIASLPLIARVGFGTWLRSSLFGAISWHLSAKCVSAGCPISSTPWEWLLGVNSFALYIVSPGEVLSATVNYPLWVTAFALAIFLLPAAIRGERGVALLSLFALGTFGGYVLLYIAGSTTQYSFYAIHLAPLVYAALSYILYKAVAAPRDYIYALRSWRRAAAIVWEWAVSVLVS